MFAVEYISVAQCVQEIPITHLATLIYIKHISKSLND